MAEESLTIRGKEIPIKRCQLEVNKLMFFPDNPRIYSAIGAGQVAPLQEEIQAKLVRMEHVKELVYDIQLNGGLIDPIIVRDGSFEVLEGNSRLAAYRELIKKDPIKWGTMRSVLLPQDIDEASVFALLGQYHIKGKKDWQPFEQAGFLYRRHKKQGIDIDTLSKELGLRLSETKNLISTYDFMASKKIKSPAKWSYYYEYIKSRKIKKIRKDFASLDSVMVKKIQSGELEKATDFRDGLKVLSEAKPKTINKLIEGSYDFGEALNVVKLSGNSNEAYQRLNRFRMWLAKEETKDAFGSANETERKKIGFELGKIHSIAKNQQSKLGR